MNYEYWYPNLCAAERVIPPYRPPKHLLATEPLSADEIARLAATGELICPYPVLSVDLDHGGHIVCACNSTAGTVLCTFERASGRLLSRVNIPGDVAKIACVIDDVTGQPMTVVVGQDMESGFVELRPETSQPGRVAVRRLRRLQETSWSSGKLPHVLDVTCRGTQAALLVGSNVVTGGSLFAHLENGAAGAGGGFPPASFVVSSVVKEEIRTQPYGVALDRDGFIVVADTGAHRIRIFNQDGVNVKSFGEFGVLPGQFRYPCAVTFSPNGYMVVVDRDNLRVQVFDEGGRFIEEFGRDQGIYLSHPSDAAVTSDGRILVADTNHERIVQVGIVPGYDWRPHLHPRFPPQFRAEVRALLHLAECHGSREEADQASPVSGLFGWLPLELLFLLIQSLAQLHWDAGVAAKEGKGAGAGAGEVRER